MKKIITILMLFFTLWLLSSCEKEVVINKKYKTYTVGTWSINTGMSYSSFTKGITETVLSTEIWWKVISLSKQKWDSVVFWEKIWFVDSSEAQVWYQTSSNIIAWLYNLKESISQTYDSQINAKQQTIKKAEEELKWIDITKENTQNTNSSEIQIYENKITEAEINLEYLKKNLEQTTNVLEWQKEKLYQNAVNNITTSLILDTSIITFVDEILWVTPDNETKNDEYEDFLSAKDSQYLKQAEELFQETNILYQEYKSFYEEYVENKEITDEKIIEWLGKWEILAWKMKELLKSLNDVLSNTIENLALTQDEINAHQQTIYDYWNSVEESIIYVSWDYITWLKWSQDSIDLLERNTQKEITLLNEQLILWQKQVELATDNLEKVKNVGDSSIDSIDTNKEIWNINILEINENIKSLEKEKLSKLQEINLQIEEARWNSNMEIVKMWNAEIASPYDWIITEKYIEIWTIINAWTPVYKIANQQQVKLEIYLNQSNISNIEVGQNLQIEIEWKTKSYTGTITNIPNTKDIENKNTQVEITIDNVNWEITLWNIAKVYLSNDSETGIIIPNKAIISDFMIPSVMVVKDNVAHLKNIQIIKQNDDYSLIEWIEINETIIIEWQENIWDSEILN